MEKQLANIKETFTRDIKNIKSISDLSNIKVEYLGKKGLLTAVQKSMGSLTATQRPVMGILVNEVREYVESNVKVIQDKLEEDELKELLKKEVIDITLPGKATKIGTIHPINKAIEEVTDIFTSMGYSIAEGPEIELTRYNFDALNTPLDHPARDIQDTFYITDDIILRTQTSPVQIRTMEKMQPPIKVICPGKVYRSDEIDATHSAMFHQIEGLVIDKGITMADLKGTLETFAREMFGDGTKIRLRPHHFPFTEPSAEVDVSCFVCGSKGCKVCKNEGWIEILGAGMVHPKVLEAGGIDPNIYSGFAFGLGAERIAMTKYAVNDMRFLFENDIRFLQQFK